MFTAFLVMSSILGVIAFLAFLSDEYDAIRTCFVLWIIGCLIIGLIWTLGDDESKKPEETKNEKIAISQEIAKAYYQGQRDYAEGNIHIRDVNYDHCYHWESSPWKDTNIDSIPYTPDCVVEKDSNDGTR